MSFRISARSSLRCELPRSGKMLSSASMNPSPSRSTARLAAARFALANRALALARALLPHRYRDLEQTVLELGARLLGIGTFRQRDQAVELPVGSLRAIEALALLLLIELALTLDHDAIVRHLHVNFVLPHSREL